MDFNAEYMRLLDLQKFDPDELDYSILERHVDILSAMAEMSNSGISVFDMYRRNHPFVSRNFGRLFKYDLSRIKDEDVDYFDLQIHPDDFPYVMRNGVTGLRCCMENKDILSNGKLLTEYRINLSGQWVRVVEQMQPLELDSRGNIWLALSVLNISPNQAKFDHVDSRIWNLRTGEILPLPVYPEYEEPAANLTPREMEVLRLVRDGYLSKEISDNMKISVHTVNTYRQRILEKLGVSNSMEAVRVAARMGGGFLNDGVLESLKFPDQVDAVPYREDD